MQFEMDFEATTGTTQKCLGNNGSIWVPYKIWDQIL